MKTLTVRFGDRTYHELNAMAHSRGVSLSDLTRATMGTLLEQEPGEDGRLPGETPQTLTAFERRQLALLHRILARLVGDDPSTEDGNSDDQLRLAKVLENGYVAEYDTEFMSIRPELSRRETNWVVDVLEMFTQLEWSYEQLSENDRKKLGKDAERAIHFKGFDLNDRIEGRLHGYARYLIREGSWERLAKYFDREHEGGNSHMPTYDVYARMLEGFRPIWSAKLREGRESFNPNTYLLDHDEINRVLDARIHPTNR